MTLRALVFLSLILATSAGRAEEPVPPGLDSVAGAFLDASNGNAAISGIGTNDGVTNLTSTSSHGARLVAVDLKDAKGQPTGRLWPANLSEACLKGADLTGADLSHANLSGADLSDAVLRDVNLLGANLKDAKLDGADTTGAQMDDKKIAATG